MKKIPLLLVIAAFILAAGCKKVTDLANINVDIPYSTQVTIPEVAGGTPGVPIPGTVLNFPAVPVATDSKHYIEEYRTSSSKIISVDLKSLSIAILAPATQNFDFLDTAQLYISAPDQPELIVAYQYDIPKGQQTLNLNTITSVNLKNYFLADTLYLRMRTHINAVPQSGATLKITTTFHMLANPLD